MAVDNPTLKFNRNYVETEMVFRRYCFLLCSYSYPQTLVRGERGAEPRDPCHEVSDIKSKNSRTSFCRVARFCYKATESRD